MSTLLEAHTNDYHFMNVQEHWNAIELAILETVDTSAPLTDVKINRNNKRDVLYCIAQSKYANHYCS